MKKGQRTIREERSNIALYPETRQRLNILKIISGHKNLDETVNYLLSVEETQRGKKKI